MSTTTKSTHVDQRYINGLLENHSSVIHEIYDRFSAKVKSFVLKNNGNEEDAADVFQEALINIYRQAKAGTFLLTCPFEAFLLLICKRKWINELKKRSTVRVTNKVELVSNTAVDELFLADQFIHQEARRSLFLAMFEKLGDKCKEIIRCSLNGKPQEENAAAMGLTYGFFRKKKSECMAILAKYVQANQPLMKR